MAIPTPGDTNVVFMIDSMATSTGNTAELQWNTRPGWWYQVWQSSNLQTTGTVWTPYGDPMLGAGASLSTNVPRAASGQPLFYRIEQVEP
jgi:hypothetical protein